MRISHKKIFNKKHSQNFGILPGAVRARSKASLSLQLMMSSTQ